MIASARQENDTFSLEPESFVDLTVTETNPVARDASVLADVVWATKLR